MLLRNWARLRGRNLRGRSLSSVALQSMHATATRGRDVASAVAGAWRVTGRLTPISNDTLVRLAPPLTAGAVAALTWFSLRQRYCQYPPPVVQLYRPAYINSAIHAAAYEIRL